MRSALTEVRMMLQPVQRRLQRNGCGFAREGKRVVSDRQLEVFGHLVQVAHLAHGHADCFACAACAACAACDACDANELRRVEHRLPSSGSLHQRLVYPLVTQNFTQAPGKRLADRCEISSAG